VNRLRQKIDGGMPRTRPSLGHWAKKAWKSATAVSPSPIRQSGLSPQDRLVDPQYIDFTVEKLVCSAESARNPHGIVDEIVVPVAPLRSIVEAQLYRLAAIIVRKVIPSGNPADGQGSPGSSRRPRCHRPSR